MLALDWQLIAMKMDRSITGSRQNILHHHILSIGVQSKNPDISGAIFTLSLSILILNSQCEEGTRDVRVFFNWLRLVDLFGNKVWLINIISRNSIFWVDIWKVGFFSWPCTSSHYAFAMESFEFGYSAACWIYYKTPYFSNYNMLFSEIPAR